MASLGTRCSSTAYATVVRGERMAPTYYNYFPKISSTCLGITQIACSVGITIVCCVCFGFLTGILLTLLLQFPLMALIAGSFGIGAGAKKTTFKIVTNLVMSILACINSCGLFILAGVALGLTAVAKEQFESSTTYDTTSIYYQLFKNNPEAVERVFGYFIALMVLSLIETVVAMTSAIIGCHFVCFCCKNCCCQFDVTTTDNILMLHGDEEPLMSGSVVIQRNDADVPMISVDDGAGLVQPYMAPSFVAQPSSYLVYPK